MNFTHFLKPPSNAQLIKNTQTQIVKQINSKSLKPVILSPHKLLNLIT